MGLKFLNGIIVNLVSYFISTVKLRAPWQNAKSAVHRWFRFTASAVVVLHDQLAVTAILYTVQYILTRVVFQSNFLTKQHFSYCIHFYCTFTSQCYDYTNSITYSPVTIMSCFMNRNKVFCNFRAITKVSTT